VSSPEADSHFLAPQALALAASGSCMAAAPPGPSAGFLSLLEEMESERRMWEEKTMSLVAGVRSPGRPATAASAPVLPGSRPGTGSIAVAAAQGRAAAGDSPAAEAAQEEGVAQLADGLPVASFGALEGVNEDWREEAEEASGRIAAALRAAGVEPSLEAMAELVRCSESPAGRNTLGTSTWASSSRMWAAQRMRQKKEHCGLRSGATTPVASAAGNTPCGSSNCALPLPRSRPSTTDRQPATALVEEGCRAGSPL